MDSLYVIAEQFRQVAEMIENAAETGEDLEVLNDTLEAIGGEFEVRQRISLSSSRTTI